MNSHNLTLISMTIGLVLGLMLLPNVAFAEDDGTAAQTVFMEDMLVADNDDVEVDVDTNNNYNNENNDVEQRTDGPHWAATIGQSALWGGLTGALVGLGVWLVTDMDFDPWVIAQFAGGGILVGTTIGVINVLVTGDQYAYEKPASVEWVERDAPRTYDFRLFRMNF